MIDQFQKMIQRELASTKGMDLNRLIVWDGIKERKALAINNPENKWLIFELCKQICELAELANFDFNNVSLSRKIVIVSVVLDRSTFPDSFYQGVKEYHHSLRNRKG